MKMRKILASAAAAVVACSAFAVNAFAADDTYHAYIGIQTDQWSFRNSWNDGTYGKDTEYFDGITGWVDNVATNVGGSFTDVDITGNGTYKVAVEGDIASLATEKLNLLFISTDIPVSDDVVFSDVKVLFDGSEVYSVAEGVKDPDQKETINLLLINIWNSDLETFDYTLPSSKIEIEFTVSGLGDDDDGNTSSTTTTTTSTTTTTTSTTTTSTTKNPSTGATAGLALAGLALAGAAVVATKKNK